MKNRLLTKEVIAKDILCKRFDSVLKEVISRINLIDLKLMIFTRVKEKTLQDKHDKG